MMASNFRENSKFLLMLAMFVFIQGCASIRPPTNVALDQIDEQSGYRRPAREAEGSYGDTLVLLAFSGGGTRAAALSYGVLQELRDTVVVKGNETTRLLDEVDNISSVSGGSFTSAYYGLYRDKIFEDYEKDFLRLGVQEALIWQLFNPVHWFRSAFTGFNRTEMAIDYYDRHIFKRATFADLTKNGSPYIDINTTDLTTGLRFSFSQDLFDLMCTDLDQYTLARAVTASSAVPVVFPTVVLKNYADRCSIDSSEMWQALREVDESTESEAQKVIVDNLQSLRNSEQRPYIHLVDGGIADNLGLRAIVDQLEVLGDEQFELALKEHYLPKSMLVLLVNAEVKRETLIEKTPETPSAANTMSSYTNALMERYRQETVDRLTSNLDRLKTLADEVGEPINIYYSEVNFDLVKEKEINRLFNSLPTSLSLEDNQIDMLISAGRLLLRNEEQFTSFKQQNQFGLSEQAVSNEVLCTMVDLENCVGN